ncbi:MAG TPA: hypothetical protein PKL39_06680 [Bacillota bacterium]|nr:hypothetical protein [Bacillota bacterium]HPZ91218.1 hypothetical protein [Bacillota bacterium]HQE02364.1 hypothetical protein [Bacillota bacterium]
MLSLDLTPIATQIEALLMDREFFLNRAKTLNPAEHERLLKLPDAELRQAQEEAVSQLKAQLNLKTVEVDLLAEITKDNPELADNLARFSRSVRLIGPAFFIAIGICLFLIALMLLIRLRPGLIATAVALIVSGGFLFLLFGGSGFFMPALPENVDHSAAKAASAFMANMLTIPRNIALIYWGGALVAIVAAILLKRIKKAGQTAEI